MKMTKMAKDSSENPTDMQSEYNFAAMKGGERGKYYRSYRAGHTVKIHKTDGTTLVQYFTIKDGAVMLDPDVFKYFPDSEAVNHALRCLIPLMQKEQIVRVTK